MTESIGFAGKYLAWREKKTFERYSDYLNHIGNMEWWDLHDNMNCNLPFISGILKMCFGTPIYIVLSVLLFIPDWICQSRFRVLNILIFPIKFIINLFAAILCYPFILVFAIFMFTMVSTVNIVVGCGMCIYIVCKWGSQKESITPAEQQDIESGIIVCDQPIQKSFPAGRFPPPPPPAPVYSAPVVEKDTGKMECGICNVKKDKLLALQCSHQICINCYNNLPTKQCPYCRADIL